MPITVMIVDDQPLIRSGLRAVLESAQDIVVVGESADGAEAVSVARQSRPDVVIMDLGLPLIDGLDATVQLLRLPEAPTVLVLTTFNADDKVIDALTAGASGFLLKDVRREELTAAIRVLAAGGTVMSREITARLARRAGRGLPTGRSGLEEKLAMLSDSEREVLSRVGAGLSNQQIADELHLSLASVKTYVSRTLARLQLDNRTQAAILAYEAGLVVSADPL